VVVLYGCTLKDSVTLQSLAEFCRQESDLSRRISLLIYDNSPISQEAGLEDWNYGVVEYRHAAENGGLAAAYNEALEMARERDIEWLLLLDQDTVLPTSLFPFLFASLASLPSPEICALVPKLVQNGKILSPQIVGQFHNRDCPPAFSGVSHRHVTAFNSAACLRVQALLAIGGFSREYWLDYLDHITFYRLQAVGGQVLILNIVLKHRLSLQNLEAEMSLDRYENLLASEWRFVRETGAGGGPLAHRMRLLKRALSHSIQLKNKIYALRTLRAIWQ
jgi:GT2 family glycosyltransferase